MIFCLYLWNRILISISVAAHVVDVRRCRIDILRGSVRQILVRRARYEFTLRRLTVFQCIEQLSSSNIDECRRRRIVK